MTGKGNFLYQYEESARRELDAVLEDIASTPWPSDVAEARALYDAMGPAIAEDIRVEPVNVGSIPAQLLTPPDADAHRALLFLHGGGYVYGSLASHGGMAAEIARHSKCKALQLQYRLAPEHPFPAAIEDACAAYESLLLQGHRPEDIAFVGDSAGGGLVMAALATLKSQARPLPGAAVCVSPWVDLEASGESYSERQALDPMIERELVGFLAELYLNGQDPKTPLASPVHADLHGMPPLLIQVGECEVLFSEAARLYEKARASGVEVTFEEWPQMVHVWHLYFPMLAAGREAIARIGAFVYDKTAGVTPCLTATRSLA
jgi:monoterpene epsilon-lactone hydrolase